MFKTSILSLHYAELLLTCGLYTRLNLEVFSEGPPSI